MSFDYVYNNSIINSISSQSGGKYGKNAFLKLSMYFLLLTAFIFEIVDPLTNKKAQEKFKKNRELFTSFTIFSVIIPILIFYFIWSSEGQSPKKRKGTIYIIIAFLLLHFSITFAALIYSNAYGDNSCFSVKMRVLFYFRIIFLYAGMMLSVITVALKI
jgi:ACR3 family arsenite efflux pump ArsB